MRKHETCLQSKSLLTSNTLLSYSSRLIKRSFLLTFVICVLALICFYQGMSMCLFQEMHKEIWLLETYTLESCDHGVSGNHTSWFWSCMLIAALLKNHQYMDHHNFQAAPPHSKHVKIACMTFQSHQWSVWALNIRSFSKFFQWCTLLSGSHTQWSLCLHRPTQGIFQACL